MGRKGRWSLTWCLTPGGQAQHDSSQWTHVWRPQVVEVNVCMWGWGGRSAGRGSAREHGRNKSWEALMIHFSTSQFVLGLTLNFTKYFKRKMKYLLQPSPWTEQ